MQGRFQRGGLRWELDLNEGIDFSIFLLGAFESGAARCYKKRLRRGDVALDIGANIGAHTLPMASLVGPAGRVHAFEPTAYAFRKLNANLALNPELEDVVRPVQMLLGEGSKGAIPHEIYSGWPLEFGENLHPTHGGEPHSTAGASMATLDELVDQLGRVDFIKLDVDGYELSVLQGARRLLDHFRPPILMEFCPHVCVTQGHSFAELVAALTEACYRFERLDGKPLPTKPGMLAKMIPRNGSINVLAVPHDTRDSNSARRRASETLKYPLGEVSQV